jgi:2',3'-cyclic-nucleotide 2'-phosphodiesterase (5'-nucleotidase family)
MMATPRLRIFTHAAVAAALTLSCGHGTKRAPRRAPHAATGSFTLSIVGTNDLHGALERLPIFGGYLRNLRAARANDQGAVMVVDAGDMFQGTLESNLAEGADVIAAYNQLGYAAAVVGNHEFDFGPPGPAVTIKTDAEDARGALKARAAEAKFPLLVGNINDAKTSANMPASTVVTLLREGDAAPIKVGIIGMTTESTPFTTMPANFIGLQMASPALSLTAEAKRLRASGVHILIATMHIGSKCTDLHNPNDIASCDSNEELFKVLSDVPKGLIDVVIAGHTHAAMAHRINDSSVIESYSSGRAFGRVDLRLNTNGHVVSAKIFEPQDLCAKGQGENPVPVEQCVPSPYEGQAVVVDPEVKQIVDAAIARTGKLRNDPLGVTVTAAIWKAYDKECPLGNLFTDLMLAAQPQADVALTNGGGLRADLPAGKLTFGQVFEAMPFDNRFALVDVQGKHLRRMISNNLTRAGAIHSWGGVTASARCVDHELKVDILVKGKPLVDDKSYKLVTSDFLASGTQGVIGRLKLPVGAVKTTEVIIRDAMVEVLRKRQGTLDPSTLFDRSKPRLSFPGDRPVSCADPNAPKAPPPEPD